MNNKVLVNRNVIFPIQLLCPAWLVNTNQQFYSVNNHLKKWSLVEFCHSNTLTWKKTYEKWLTLVTSYEVLGFDTRKLKLLEQFHHTMIGQWIFVNSARSFERRKNCLQNLFHVQALGYILYHIEKCWNVGLKNFCLKLRYWLKWILSSTLT